jgi:transglutaminase-like putative cysteine protease
MSNLMTKAIPRGAGPSMAGGTPEAGASIRPSVTAEAPLSRDEFVSTLSKLASALPKPARVSIVAEVCKLDLQLGLELAVASKLKVKDLASILCRSDVREFQQNGIDTLGYLVERTLASTAKLYCSSRRSVKNFRRAIGGESLPAEPIPEAIRPILTAYFSPLLKQKELEALPTRPDPSPRIVTDSLRLATQLLEVLDVTSSVDHDGQGMEAPTDTSDVEGIRQASQDRADRLLELQKLQACYRRELQTILLRSHETTEPVVVALPHPVPPQEKIEVLSSVWLGQAVVQTSDWRMHVNLKTGETYTVSTAQYPAEPVPISEGFFTDISRSPSGKVVLTSAGDSMEFNGRAEPVHVSGRGTKSNLIQVSSETLLQFISVDGRGNLYTAAQFRHDISSKTLFIKIGDHKEIQIQDVSSVPSVETDGIYWVAQVGDERDIFTFHNGSQRLIRGLGRSGDTLLLRPKGILLELSHKTEAAVLHDLVTDHSQRIQFSEFHQPGYIARFRNGYISSHYDSVREGNLQLLFHAPSDKGDEAISGVLFLEKLWRNQPSPVYPNILASGAMLEFTQNTIDGRHAYIYDGARVTEIGPHGWIYDGCELDGNFYFVVREGNSISLHAALPEGVVIVDTLPDSVSRNTKVEVYSSGSGTERCHYLTLTGPQTDTFRIDRDGFIPLSRQEFIRGGHVIRLESDGSGSISELTVLPAKSNGLLSKAERELIDELHTFFQTNDPASLSPTSRHKIAMTQKTKNQLSDMHAHILSGAMREHPEAFVGRIPVDTHSFSLNRGLSEALLAALVPSFSKLIAARQRYENRFSGTKVMPSDSVVFDGLGDDPDTAHSVIFGALDTEYDGFLASGELGQIENTKVTRCTLPETKQGKSAGEKLKVTLDIEKFSYCESISLPIPLQARVTISKTVSQRRTDTPGAVTLNICDKTLKKVSYSFRPEAPVRFVPPTQQQYDAFVEGLDPSVKRTLTTKSLVPPSIAQAFLRDIAHHPPLTRALMIRDWIAEHGQYEKGYYEFRALRAKMSLSEKLRFMTIRASMLSHTGKDQTRKLFSGVCADYALLALAMYRVSGLVATVATGYMVAGQEIDTRHAHALNIIYFPDANGLVRKFELDATPSSSGNETHSQDQTDALDSLRRTVERSANPAPSGQQAAVPEPAAPVEAADSQEEIDVLPEMKLRPGSEIQRILRILEYTPPFECETVDALLANFHEHYFPISENYFAGAMDDDDIRTGVIRISRRRFWSLGRDQAVADAQRVVEEAIQHARGLLADRNLPFSTTHPEPPEQ